MGRVDIFEKIRLIFANKEVPKTEILNIEMNINLKSKYRKFLQREISLTNLSAEEIIEAGLELYAKSNNAEIVEIVSEQELMIEEFKNELRAFLKENLKPDSTKYDVVFAWCDCIKEEHISTRNLDFQIRRIIEMLYNKHQDTAKAHFKKMGIDRFSMRDIIVKIIDEGNSLNE
ncbi:hypothetical protein UT300012_22710 [Paraclostridium bifermentans]